VNCDRNMGVIEGEVCAQIRGADGHTWFTQNNTCYSDDAYGTSSVTPSINPTCTVGHLYRAWDWGYAKDYNGQTWLATNNSNNTLCAG
jgi:hypothetical protein